MKRKLVACLLLLPFVLILFSFDQETGLLKDKNSSVFIGVESFTLIDVDNDVDLFELVDGQQITSSFIAGRELNIRANATGSIGRVEFQLSGTLTRNHTEIGVPYALYSDQGGAYLGQEFPVGDYQLTATAFDSADGGNQVGEVLSILFSITESADSDNGTGGGFVNPNKPQLRITLNTTNSTQNYVVGDPSNTESFRSVEGSDESITVAFELIFPEGVESTTDPVNVSFLASDLTASYIDPNVDFQNEQDLFLYDYYLDKSAGTNVNNPLSNIIESTAGVSADFTLTSNGNPNSPDAVLTFVLIDDQSERDSTFEERFLFTVYGDVEDNYSLQNANENGNVFLPIIIQDGQVFEYNLLITNSGSTESPQGSTTPSKDIVTVTLLRNSFIGSQDLVPYAPSTTDGDQKFNVSLAGKNSGLLANESTAEATDFNLPNNEDYGYEITIPVGQSSTSFEIELGTDADGTNKDMYNVAVSYESNTLSDVRSDPYSIGIIDIDGIFDIEVFPPTAKEIGNKVYQVEEGESFFLEFIPEKGTPLGDQYSFAVSTTNNQTTGDDYSIKNLSGGRLSYSNSSQSINTVEIEIAADEIFNEGNERFELRLSDPLKNGVHDPLKFIQQFSREEKRVVTENSDKVSELNYTIEIIDVLPAGIRPVNENDSVVEDSGEFAEFEVFLAADNKTAGELEVFFQISANSTAEIGTEEGKDYRLEINNQTVVTSDKFFTSIPTDTDRLSIKVFPIANSIDDNENKTVIIELVDGPGYNLPNTTDYPRSAVATIIEDDGLPDGDGDGVPDAVDQCPDTPANEQADSAGCSPSQRDTDNDGVKDSVDLCPNTDTGSVVDASGCAVFSLPTNNFVIQSNGESCRTSDNGSILISAQDTSYIYTVTLTGMNSSSGPQAFSENYTFSDLESGNYELCIQVDIDVNYEQCFEINLPEPDELSVSSKINQENSKVTLDLAGGEIYYIELNDVFYQTSESQITLELMRTENKLKVSTDKFCQGSFEKTIILSDQILVYPNPIGTEDLSVYVGQVSSEKVHINLYNSVGTLVSTQSYIPEAGLIRMNLNEFSTGLYLLNVSTNTTLKTLKLIKR